MAYGPPFVILSTCKGGGYMYCRTSPPHPKANAKGLYPLHRVLVENELGRLLGKDEVVHHRDENKQNDSIENLEVKSRSSHARDHVKYAEPVQLTCPKCGTQFQLQPSVYRWRLKHKVDRRLTCSRACGSSR